MNRAHEYAYVAGETGHKILHRLKYRHQIDRQSVRINTYIHTADTLRDVGTSKDFLVSFVLVTAIS